MEDFSSWDAPQWNNIQQQSGPTISPVSIPSVLILDPIHELREYHDQHSNVAVIPWSEGAPIPSSSSVLMINQPNNFSDAFLPFITHGPQYQPLDGSNHGSSSESMDPQPGLTNSNTAETTTTSVEDDGISVIFSDSKNSLWNFTSAEPSRYLRMGSAEDSNFGGWCDPSKGRKRLKSSGSSNISFGSASASTSIEQLEAETELDPEAIQQMKEMIYIAAAFRPVNLGNEVVERPRRKNVRISSDPQTVAARQRREKISERLRVLQKLVPGGSKMDTASMLDEAANYLKFLSNQVKALEAISGNSNISQYYPPINLQFTPMPLIPMQELKASSPIFSYSKP